MTTYTALPDPPQKNGAPQSPGLSQPAGTSRRFAETRPCALLSDDARPQGLTPEQVTMIEEALSSLGDYGEVHLIVEKGRLRFLVTQKSYDALKWTPGCIAPDEG